MKEKDTEALMVTVRCTAYNHESYIQQCLEGFVIQKTNFRFEVIVHDDASTDGTVTIIQEYAEKYPNIIKPIFETENQYSKRDGSLARIMDEHTHGKYVAFCEGDDYWVDPLKLQKQVDFLETHPEYGMVHTNFQYYINRDNAFIDNFQYSPKDKLDIILCEYKYEKSARNNRNVSIRKLRVLLEKVGDIQVVFENNFWKIIFGNEVFCDYVAAIQFIQDTSFDDFTKEATLYRLLELLVFGPLLPNTQADWIDNFKSDYSDITLDLLHSLLQKKEFEDKEDIQLLIADTIFLHDIFNEEALRVKCSILYKKDKRSIAKSTYDNFCKQYKSLLGTDYKISFSTIVTSKTTS